MLLTSFDGLKNDSSPTIKAQKCYDWPQDLQEDRKLLE